MANVDFTLTPRKQTRLRFLKNGQRNYNPRRFRPNNNFKHNEMKFDGEDDSINQKIHNHSFRILTKKSNNESNNNSNDVTSIISPKSNQHTQLSFSNDNAHDVAQINNNDHNNEQTNENEHAVENRNNNKSTLKPSNTLHEDKQENRALVLEKVLNNDRINKQNNENNNNNDYNYDVDKQYYQVRKRQTNNRRYRLKDRNNQNIIDDKINNNDGYLNDNNNDTNNDNLNNANNTNDNDENEINVETQSQSQRMQSPPASITPPTQQNRYYQRNKNNRYTPHQTMRYHGSQMFEQPTNKRSFDNSDNKNDKEYNRSQTYKHHYDRKSYHVGHDVVSKPMMKNNLRQDRKQHVYDNYVSNDNEENYYEYNDNDTMHENKNEEYYHYHYYNNSDDDFDENEIINKYLTLFKTSHSKMDDIYSSSQQSTFQSKKHIYQSFQMLDLRLGNHILNDMESMLTNNEDFLVIGVIGQQSVGKSTILSYLSGFNENNNNNEKEIFGIEDIYKLMHGSHETCGIQGYITKQRIIFLDTQPILSPSILLSLTYHFRKIMREQQMSRVSPTMDDSSIQNAMSQWEYETFKLALYLVCVCHVLIVVSDWLNDTVTWDFLRAIYNIRQSTKLSPFLRQQTMHHQFKQHHNMNNHNNNNNGSNNKSGNNHIINNKNHEEFDKKFESMLGNLGNNIKEEYYKTYELINTQQHYGFPDIIFVFNKIPPMLMTPSIYVQTRYKLYQLFKFENFINNGEIANEELIAMYNSLSNNNNNNENDNNNKNNNNNNDDNNNNNENNKKIDDLASKMNVYFLPLIGSNIKPFSDGCQNLRNQILSMSKPKTQTKCNELQWFQYSRQIWREIDLLPNLMEYKQLPSTVHFR